MVKSCISHENPHIELVSVQILLFGDSNLYQVIAYWGTSHVMPL